MESVNQDLADLFDKDERGSARFEFVTGYAAGSPKTHDVIALALETAPFPGSTQKKKFQCAMTIEQAMTIGQALQELAVQQLSKT